MSLTRRVFVGSFVTVLGGAVWASQGGLDAITLPGTAQGRTGTFDLTIDI